jgi:hypothetical protein
MKGGFRIAAVGVAVLAVVSALTSTAGAQTTVTKWNVTGNGGFVSLGLLNTLQLAGGGSEADASSSPLAEAEGTGLCVDDSAPATNPCPTSATTSTSGNSVPNATQDAVADGSGVTATPTGGGCTLPVNTTLVDVDVSCGTASASTDSNGDPTASGTGSLAGVSISLSLTQVLQSILGGALPSASALCADAPAASSSPGSNTAGLDQTLQGILGSANGLLSGLAPLNPTSVAPGSDVTGECSILGGVLNELTASSGASSVTGRVTGILDQLLGLAGGAGVSVTPLTIDLGGSTTAVSTNGNVVTDSVTQHALDVNLFGLADLQVAPTAAAVSLDRSTGTVTPSCTAGVASYSVAGGVQQFLALGSLTQLVDNILAQLSSTLNSLTSALSGLVGEILSYNPNANLLNCSVSDPGTTANAAVGVANLGLLTGLQGGIALNVGDVSVSGSSTAAPAVTTAAATTPAAPAAAPAAVPGVTTVHTGEYWAGDLPIVLLVGMALAGIVLIGRRRILSVARALHPFARRTRSGR